MGVSISQKKGWVITRKAFDRMLAWPHPDSERACDQCEKILQKPVNLFEGRRGASANRRQRLLIARRSRQMSSALASVSTPKGASGALESTFYLPRGDA